MPTPMISFVTYFVYAYLALPLTYTGVKQLYATRYQICPLVRCIRPLAKCLQDPLCRAWLDDVAECSNEDSQVRQDSANTFAYVQYPNDPAFCRYQSFDRLETETALQFLECIGQSGCLEPSTYTDTCAVTTTQVLSLDVVTPVLEGRWFKLYTTGWDVWPCQWTDFWAPHSSASASASASTSSSSSIEADDWMTEWPNNPRVWRMDLYWENKAKNHGSEDDDDGESSSLTFHMNNEMYPDLTWDFENSQDDVTITPSSTATTTPPPPATLKTRAVMWGTEAHENWYLLDYQEDLQTMVIYYCAHTEAVGRFDSMAMILQKEGAPILTETQSRQLEERARRLLGETHGNFQRIATCATSS